MIFVLFCLFSLILCETSQPKGRPIDAIKHIIIIVQENWSFDGLFGLIKGVDGVKPETYIKQTNKDGVPYKFLEAPDIEHGHGNWTLDTRFPNESLNEWCNLTKYVPNHDKTRDLVHRFYTHQLQLNRDEKTGQYKMDKFYQYTDSKILTMSYVGHYDDLPFQREQAEEHVICNRFFQSHFGGSFLSHFWLVANAAPVWPKSKPIPPHLISNITNGVLIRDAPLTVDGKYAVNTIYSENTPYPPHWSTPEERLPPQTMTNMGDELSKKGLDWRWYAGGWDDVINHPNNETLNELFQYHHQPFAYFAKYGTGTEERKKHLFDEKVFYQDLKNDKLPSVSWVKFFGNDNQHPGYADLVSGNIHLNNIVKRVKNSKLWNETLIIITHDEFGGRFDHVPPPPPIDEFGPGTRIATVLISPYTKKRFVDNTSYYTHDSINRLLGLRFGIKPVNKRVETALFFDNAFDWESTGRCCPKGFKLKAGATCTFEGANEGDCEIISKPFSNSLYIMLIVALVVIGVTVFFLIAVMAIVGCKNTNPEQEFTEVSQPINI